MERLKRDPYTFSLGLNSAEFIKHLHAEEKRLRAALTDLGLAKQ